MMEEKSPPPQGREDEKEPQEVIDSIEDLLDRPFSARALEPLICVQKDLQNKVLVPKNFLKQDVLQQIMRKLYPEMLNRKGLIRLEDLDASIEITTIGV